MACEMLSLGLSRHTTEADHPFAGDYESPTVLHTRVADNKGKAVISYKAQAEYVSCRIYVTATPLGRIPNA